MAWISPDGRISKNVVVDGVWGKKPSEQSECEIRISECPPDMLIYNNSIVIIGDSDNYLRRTLDACLIAMNENEVASFKVDDIQFTLHLVKVVFHGWIYQWDAGKKIDIALKHKESGALLYRKNCYKDAAYRFIKGLKVITSIPIDVECTPLEIDGIPLEKITQLKVQLYNNLASCYLKNENWSVLVEVCKKIFEYEQQNIKAHYKIALAYMQDRNFEAAERSLEIVLGSEPLNKAALEKMKIVHGELRKQTISSNNIIKKMFK